jgi:hypothetical protein
MSQPSPDYTRNYSFTDHSAQQPNVPQPGSWLDIEFNEIRDILNNTGSRLSEIQQDDGKINGDAFSTYTYNQIAQSVATALNLEADYATKVYVNSQGFATQSYVTSRGYITAAALSPYLQTSIAQSTFLTIATAASTYQPISAMSSYLPLTGGTMSGTLYASTIRNPLNENFIIDAYNDDAAGTHNLFKFNPFGGGLELPTGSAGIKFGDGTDQVTAGLPLTGGTMSGAIRFDSVGTQNIAKGSFDSGRGGYNGISLICAVDYELNWQAGYLKALNSGGFVVPINVDQSSIIVRGLPDIDDLSFTTTLSDGVVNVSSSQDGSASFDVFGIGGTTNGGPTWGLSVGGAGGDDDSDSNWGIGYNGAGGGTSTLTWGIGGNSVSGEYEDSGFETKTWSLGENGLKFIDGTIQTTAAVAGLPINPDNGDKILDGYVVLREVLDAQYDDINGFNGQIYLSDFSGGDFNGRLILDYNGIQFRDNSFQSTAGLPLTGGTLTGKLNLNPTGTTTAPLNLKTGIIPASPLAGDVWIVSDSLNYRNTTGTTRVVATMGNNNAFTNYQSISVSNNSNPALKITQTGTGEALRVEDETSPDATAFVVSNNGRVGIGVAPDATVALTVDSTGIKVNGATLVPASAVTNPPITSGNMSHSEYLKELVITINGVNYAIPLRIV